ncbi:MAG: DUF3006 domain-containing protein [bacterium]
MADDTKVVRAVVDRIESGTAVLQLIDLDVTLDFPIVLLPSSVSEGSVIEINVEDRPDLEEKRRREIEKMQHQLIEKPRDEGNS